MVGDKVKEDVVVLGADEEKPTLGWTVREYMGTEVYRVGAPGVPILEEGGLQVGDRVLIANLEMTVGKGGEGLYAEVGNLYARLAFDEDDRHSWVCTYAKRKGAWL
jgi:hypothetical protein